MTVAGKASICLCMIAKDEERHIERCIRSVRELVDEIVVVDTGSTDNTAALAESLGAAVYAYPWDGSFANARNFAIGKAASEWLLLLDADEALDQESLDAVGNFVRTTSLDGAHLRIRNYTGSYSPDNYSLHSALRLLRNTGEYRFRGDIHEQIVSDSYEKLSARFTPLNAVVHHYGYLDQIVREKQKRRRNIPILEKQLAENPHEPFTLFNMGNEYLSLRDYQAALQYYEQALGKLENRRIAFVPHLFFRKISCHVHLGDHRQALRAVEEGLREYPPCTDFEYLRGDILHQCKRYTLAIDSLEQCLRMGAPPMQLEFLPGCGTYRPAYQLGELYYGLEDYGRALKYFDLALSHKPNLYPALYRSGAALNRLLDDKNQVREKLFSYFANPKYAPNALMGADILINQGLYEQALRSLEGLENAAGRETELAYVKGRALFYQQQFAKALPLLASVCQAPEPAETILRGIRPSSAFLLLALAMMENDPELLSRALGYIQALCGPGDYGAAALMRIIFLRLPEEDPQFAQEGKAELQAMLRVLDMLLKCRRFDLFEQLLHALNFVDSKDILLRLAELYDDNSLPRLAAEYVLRSIKELDCLDAAGASILFRQTL